MTRLAIAFVFFFGAFVSRGAAQRAIELPPVMTVPAVAGLEAASFAIVLERSTPPRGAPIVHFENERRIVGQEAPQFTPARNMDVVVDRGARREPFEGVLLACPSARLERAGRFWIRDHLGDGRWRVAVALATQAPIGTTTPCAGGPSFHAASPSVVWPGAHRVAHLPLRVSMDDAERARLSASLPAPWGPNAQVHVYLADGIAVPLVRAFVELRWQLLALQGGRPLVLLDDAADETEIASVDRHIVPYAVCADGQAMLLESHCAPGDRQCRYALHPFADCPE